MEDAEDRRRPGARAPALVGLAAAASFLSLCSCSDPCPPTPAEAPADAHPADAFVAPRPAHLPFSADDLDDDHYLVTRGHSGYACAPDDDPATRHCALDLHMLRWDEGSAHYTRSRSEPRVASPALVDDVMWGMPVRSPIDGEVIACWRRMPDDDLDGDDVNCPGGAETCTAAGNHLVIRARDRDQVIILAHLQAESIPRELCPIDDVYLYTSDPKICALGGGWSGWRERGRLDRRGLAPIPVARGELVGRVGSSGSGVGVHLHIHASAYAEDAAQNPCEGDFAPLAWLDLSVQRRVVGAEPRADAWTQLNDATLPLDGDELLLAPTADDDVGCVP